MRKWWRGSFCWDQDQRSLKRESPGVGTYTGSRRKSCRDSVVPFKEAPLGIGEQSFPAENVSTHQKYAASNEGVQREG